MSQAPQPEGSGAEPEHEEAIRTDDSEEGERSPEEAAEDKDAGPTATPEQVEQDPERDQAEG